MQTQQIKVYKYFDAFQGDYFSCFAKAILDNKNNMLIYSFAARKCFVDEKNIVAYNAKHFSITGIYFQCSSDSAFSSNQYILSVFKTANDQYNIRNVLEYAVCRRTMQIH